ncbi:DUF456 domain-containing protein [bacterium]|nr:DUF456 domain-containing protein [bacterium]
MIFLKILLILIYILGFLLLILGLGGIWVINFANLIFFLLVKRFPLWFIILGFSLAILSEILDYLISIWGAKKAKASPWSIAFSVIFSIVLGIVINSVIPVIGAIMGIFIGTFLGCLSGEMLLYKKELKRSIKASKGALMGRISSLFVKMSFGLFIIFYGILKFF